MVVNLVRDYEALRDALVELRVLPKPRGAETAAELAAHEGQVYELGATRRYLPLHRDTWEIFLSVEAAHRDTGSARRDELLREQYGDGRAEALRRHAQVAKTLTENPDVEIIPLPTSSRRPLPPYRAKPVAPKHFQTRPPMGEWFRLAREQLARENLGRTKAKQPTLEPAEVFQPLQGKRSPRYGDLKATRLKIARHLRDRDATHAEIGRVFGGLSQSAVSQMLAHQPATRQLSDKATLKRASAEASRGVVDDLLKEEK